MLFLRRQRQRYLSVDGRFSRRARQNADDQLVANVKKAMEADPDLKVYFAKGNFRGLNGYYTSGVIEGHITTGFSTAHLECVCTGCFPEQGGH